MYIHHRIILDRTGHSTYLCHFCHLACFLPPSSPLLFPFDIFIITWAGAVASKKTRRRLIIFICKKRKSFIMKLVCIKQGYTWVFFVSL